MVPSQIKYWVFGAAGAVGAFLVLQTWFNNTQFAIGAAIIGGCVGAMILGKIWDTEKESQSAASYRKMARDEEARQAYAEVAAKGAKLITSAGAAPIVTADPGLKQPNVEIEHEG